MQNKISNSLIFKLKSIGLPVAALCWVSFFWGTTWLASKEGVRHMPALQLVGIRQLIAGLLYVGFFWLKKTPFPKGQQWKPILILSIVNFVFSNGLSTWGVQYISGGLGAIIGAIFPLWIVLITLFQGEKISRLSITGFVVSFAGICVIFYDHLADFLNADFRFGIFLSLFSTLTWAFGTIYTKKQAASFNPYFSLGLQMVISSILVLIVAYCSGLTISISSIPAISWWSIAYLIVVGSVLTFIAFIYALQNLPAHISSIYAYINPIVAVIIGAYVFDEPITLAIATGGLVTVFGLYLVNYSLRKEKI